MEYYFRAEKMSVGYDRKPLIEEIEIELKKGEILTLIGPNGAGKSTVLKSITKQLALLGGTIYLGREDLKGMSGEALSQKMAVVLTQRLKTELMSCEDVVATGRYPYTGKFGILSEDDRRIVKESMELIHISELADRSFTQISDVQKQRVMLARAIAQEPKLMLLDEPTSSLDPRNQYESMELIRHCAHDHNIAVLVVIHDLNLALRFCDRFLFLKDGTVFASGGREAVTPESIRAVYGMEATVEQFDGIPMVIPRFHRHEPS